MRQLKRIRTASKKERVLLNRLDKKIGTTPGLHLWLYETSASELANVIISKAKKECKKL